MASPKLIAQGERRRKQMLDYIIKYKAKNGYSPSMPEIADAVGIVGLNAIRRHLQVMEEQGLIKMTPRVQRSIVVL